MLQYFELKEVDVPNKLCFKLKLNNVLHLFFSPYSCFSVAVTIVMDTKVACLLLIILGALTVQGAVSGNKRMNLHARQWGGNERGECSSVSLMTTIRC